MLRHDENRNRDRTVDWLIVKVLDSTRAPLSSEDLDLCYNRLELLTEKQLISVIAKVGRIGRNPSSEGSLRKSLGSYRPPHHRRPRPHRPQRRRGYNDKGSLAPVSSKNLRRINGSIFIHIGYIEDNLPTLLTLIETKGRSLLSRDEDYVDLTRIEKFTSFLEEEGLWTKQAQWELDELIDWYYYQKRERKSS